MFDVRRQVSEIVNEIRCFRDGNYARFVIDRHPEWLQGQVPVFTFHGVHPGLFEQQLRYLSDNGYRAMQLRQFQEFMHGGFHEEGKYVLLTFDDGAETLSSVGAPLLQEYGAFAAAFIVPSWVGTKGFLSWPQVKALQDRGRVDIQSHTNSHRPMEVRSEGDIAAIERELIESKEAIERRLPGHAVHSLCYPMGRGSDAAVRLSRAAGYRMNFWSMRTDRTLNRPADDPYYIVRLKHDYIFRLPGARRRSMASLTAMKIVRRLKGQAYA